MTLAPYAIFAIVIGLSTAIPSEAWPQKCPDLKEPARGTIQRQYRSLTGAKASCTYSCDKGFYLDTVSARRICVFGHWIGKDPLCLKSSCPPLDDVQGGTVKLVVGKSDGWAIYRCKSERLLVGVSARQCVGGKWLGEEPSCVVSDDEVGVNEVGVNQFFQCNFPAAPEFGDRQVQTKEGELVAGYSCSKGYQLVGPQTITCSTKLTDEIAPACLLSVFGAGDGVCDFSDISEKCQYVSDANSTFQWEIEKSDPCPSTDPKTLSRRPGVDNQQPTPMSSIQMKPLPPGLQKVINAISLPVPSQDQILKPNNDLPTKDEHVKHSSLDIIPLLPVPSCSDVPTTTLLLRLPGVGDSLPIIKDPGAKLQRANIEVGDNSPKPIRDSATFEVGPLMSSHAKYIKFSVEAPMSAVSYAVFVGGHCLPDPPGALHPVHLIPPKTDIESSHRTICLNLHSKVKCSSDKPFSFSVRVTIFFVYVDDQPGSIRFVPRGSFESFADAGCLGFRAENE